MPVKKPATSKKSATRKKPVTKPTRKLALKTRLLRPFVAIKSRIGGLLARRPHRSFRRTRRRDYVRSLSLPGYWSFTNQVRKTLWQHKWTFILLAATYAFLTAGLVGVVSQNTYLQLNQLLDTTSKAFLDGGLGEAGEAGLLLLAGLTGAFGEQSSEAQQIFASLLGLMTWLTVIWLLREIKAGRKPKLRDGLYNASSPLLSTLLVGFVVVLQLFPLVLAVIGFTTALQIGLLDGGVEAMLFWMVAGLLTLLSVYWITSSVIALVVVTLPGMYPMQALKAAGDLVVGRRIRILLRLLWGGLLTVVVWAVIMIPLILFDGWLKSVWTSIEWVPVVPVALLVMSSLSIVWLASYVYVLYRRIVDDDASPA